MGIGFGGATPTLDMSVVHARKDKIVKGLTSGVGFLFKKNGIEWIKGSARLLGDGRVEVSGDNPQTLTAKEIVVATGSAPRSVPGIELDRRRIVTSDEAMNLAEIPKSIVILGSGAIGVEFASIFNRFGSKVTVIELLPRLVPNEDEAVSAELEKSFKKKKIACLTGTTVTAAAATETGISVEARHADGKTETYTADYLLVATGRGPVTDGLGAAGARPGDGTRLHHGRHAVSHQRSGHLRGRRRHHARLAGPSATGAPVVGGRASSPPSGSPGTRCGRSTTTTCPRCTYCDPEIGSVGLTEAEAKSRGYDVAVGTFPFGVLGRAKIANEIEGFVKIVADKKYDEVLGVHMIGPRSTELVAEATHGAADGVHGRGAHADHPRPSDDGRGGRRGGARGRTARRFISDEQAVSRARRPQAGSRRHHANQRRDAPDGRIRRRGDRRPVDQEGRRRRRP